MRDNNTTNWATGLQFLQFQKNRRDHVGINRSPYEVMLGCAPTIGLSTTPIPNEILQVLQKEEDLQAHLNDKPSDNAPDNTSSNANSVCDDNSNDIPVPLNCELESTICNSLFQTNEQDKYSCELCTRSNQIQRERIASGNHLSKQAERMVPRCNKILRPLEIGDNVTIPIPSVDRGQGICYA